MSGKVNINVSGGAFTVGQLLQGENITISGDVQVQTPVEALATFHMELQNHATTRSLNLEERMQLERSVAAMEAALSLSARDKNESTLQRLRQTVEDLTGTFSWTMPFVKKVLAVCAPSMATFL